MEKLVGLVSFWQPDFLSTIFPFSSRVPEGKMAKEVPWGCTVHYNLLLHACVHYTKWQCTWTSPG